MTSIKKKTSDSTAFHSIRFNNSGEWSPSRCLRPWLHVRVPEAGSAMSVQPRLQTQNELLPVPGVHVPCRQRGTVSLLNNTHASGEIEIKSINCLNPQDGDIALTGKLGINSPEYIERTCYLPWAASLSPPIRSINTNAHSASLGGPELSDPPAVQNIRHNSARLGWCCWRNNCGGAE